MEWLKDSEWQMKHKEKEIYIMVDHKWAFAAWELANVSKTIQDDALLVHVDSHLDDIPELVRDDRYFNATSSEEIIQLMKYRRNEDDTNGYIPLEKDNFIFPSFLRNTIQDIIHISDHNQDEISLNDILNAEQHEYDFNHDRLDYTSTSDLLRCKNKILGTSKSIKRYQNIEGFRRHGAILPSNASKILDLDLDYFNDSDSFLYSQLKEENIIKENLLFLKSLCDWDLITVAFSPLYCGGYDDCIYLIKLFLEVFELNHEDFEDWL